jgi:hypothetical protein
MPSSSADVFRNCQQEVVLYHALYVPLLHGILNVGGADIVRGLAEKSAIGILWAQSGLGDVVGYFYSAWPPKPRPIFRSFSSALHDCSLILLPHASHYSTTLVRSHFEWQGTRDEVTNLFLDSLPNSSYSVASIS